MRRIALLGLTILLPGCQFAGNPLDGFGSFIGDTHTFNLHPNDPVARSENERRVSGEDVAVAPLLPEPGEVWPGPPPPIPTMQDVQKMNSNIALPPPNLGEPPPSVFPQNAVPPAPSTTP